jgi:hypothetical protein
MNRLILIGNGFDLAHGLKTSYHDFILDYLKKIFKSGLNIGINQKGYKEFSIDDYLLITIKDPINLNEFDINSSNSISELKEKFSAEIRHRIFSEKFLSTIINTIKTKSWVDIERFYYQELKKHLKKYNKTEQEGNNMSGIIDDLVRTNKQLDYIKNKLKEYLVEIQSKDINLINDLKEIIHSNLAPNITILHEQPALIDNGEILFLNFNYTQTPNYYLDTNDVIINIHGELKENKNPIIFGYGDEVDKFYEQIEDLNENEFFKHIKSFDYLKTSNYSKLLGFLEKGEFEIFVMGHSCGLSDRTMLSTIFEHKHCNKIKIFYHNTEEYRTKTYEISRHFNDKAIMRSRIVPLEESTPMPQHN